MAMANQSNGRLQSSVSIPVKRGRGRPPGSKRPKETREQRGFLKREESEKLIYEDGKSETSEPKRRGRPPGSKNKLKPETMRTSCPDTGGGENGGLEGFLKMEKSEKQHVPTGPAEKTVACSECEKKFRHEGNLR